MSANEPALRDVLAIPASEWEHFGLAGHFICGRWCRFHLCTKVGPWLVSTVGMYVHPRHSGASEMAEREWLAANPNGEEIGYQRFYETMVFKCGARCTVRGCNCGQPMTDSGADYDFRAANDPREATENHRVLCERWSTKAEPSP